MALSYYAEELKKTASAIAQPGKGILAVDESTATVGKRLASIGVENTEDNRKAYRGMLFTTEGLGNFISGAKNCGGRGGGGVSRSRGLAAGDFRMSGGH